MVNYSAKQTDEIENTALFFLKIKEMIEKWPKCPFYARSDE